MSADSTSPTRGTFEFGTTRWSIVAAAKRGGDDSAARSALSALCERYWYPLYAFVRRQGHGPEDAQDLTQEFFARLIEKEWLGGVAQERGKFRSWLLASMRHFLANEWNRRQAQKRGGGAMTFSLDQKDAEGNYLCEPAAPADAEALFDRRWAMTLLDGVLKTLETEMREAGKGMQFVELKAALTGGEVNYGEMAARLRASEGAVRVAVHRLRDRYRELLRAAVLDTVESPEDVDAELRHLFTAISL